jgi:D-psicose/D-tagatose/L-ribulose 3-epimerase
MDAERMGLHLFVWGTDWHEPRFDLPRVLATVRGLGFRGVEFPILGREVGAGVAAAARALREAGLWATASVALPPGADLLTAEGRSRAEPYLAWAVGVAADLGASVLGGPLLAPVGELPAGARRDARPAREALARLAEAADAAGVALCLEPLNRYETDTVNTLAEAAELLAPLGGRVRILADTYHLHLEEADPVASLAAHLTAVGHVHLSENHRGPLGTGHAAWRAALRALDEGAYRGRAVVEGWTGRVPELARATCLWRSLADSPEAYAAASARALGLVPA